MAALLKPLHFTNCYCKLLQSTCRSLCSTFKKHSSFTKDDKSTGIIDTDREPTHNTHDHPLALDHTSVEHLAVSRSILFPNRYRPAKQAWLESLSSSTNEKHSIIDLHPDIFATFPRLDILHNNILWQRFYRKIDYTKLPNRAEMRGGGRKPWPQKGTGRARHGSNRSPIWLRGGKIHGPRGPKSYFYMLPAQQRALGLRVALSVKYAQDDLHIVDSLDIPDDDPKYLEDLAIQRNWGYSVLFIDDTDYLPRNISIALHGLPSFNAMPVYGLNVFSMLKHETLVLTLSAVDKIEEKLLYQMHKALSDQKFHMTRTFPNANVEVPDDAYLVKNPNLYPNVP